MRKAAAHGCGEEEDHHNCQKSTDNDVDVVWGRKTTKESLTIDVFILRTARIIN